MSIASLFSKGLKPSPTLKEIQAHTPAIAPVTLDEKRPFWSVMIPTYNSARYLERTLESVLKQDPGPEEMQVAVVDGCSDRDDPEEIVSNIGKERVAFYRLPSNHGPAHTHNTCIRLSRGEWVHILHGDDMVMPGFYEVYAQTIRRYQQVPMVFGQVVVVDETDRWLKLDGITPPTGGGIIQEFTARQAWQQLVICPSVVVRRDAYERVGGFCSLFRSVTDWDMWFRLGQLGPVVSVPFPKAFYRRHGESETVRLMASGSHIQESYSLVRANIARMNTANSSEKENQWRYHWAVKADAIAWQLAAENSFEGRYNHAYWAWKLEPTMQRLIVYFKSWLILKWKCMHFRCSGKNTVPTDLPTGLKT